MTVIKLNIDEYNGIHIGDMITAYHKGYHKVVGFHQIDYQKSVQIEYVRVADSNGNPAGGKLKSCHHPYCAKVDKKELNDCRDYEKYNIDCKYDSLNKILKRIEDERDATSTN